MRGMRIVGLVVLFSVGCGGGDDNGGTPDAALPPDVFIPPGCIQSNVRDDHTVTVSGAVRDWVTGDPVAGATVDVNTAWDVDGNFPNTPTVMCPPIISFTTDANGQFGPAEIAIGSSLEPPITIFMVSGAGRAQTASDARVNGCSLGVVDCGNQGHIMMVPSETLAASWRTELAAGGMPNAAQRGLTAFLYNELGGPASGVEALEGTLVVRTLMPGVEVRYLNADRETLAAADQTTTLASGVALIGLDATDNEAFVAGRRGTQNWTGLGVLMVDGWIFLEDKLVSP